MLKSHHLAKGQDASAGINSYLQIMAEFSLLHVVQVNSII